MIAYLRVSTEEQALHGFGLDAQEHELTRAFEYEGWELVDLVRDEGVSGKDLNRPELRRALEMIAAGDADGLAVAKLDRLSRSVIDFSDLLEWFDHADARFVALDLKVDTATPSGRMIASILMVIAEWELGTISVRTKAGLAAKRAQGQPTGRPSVADRPDLLERIQLMRHQERMSLKAIADQLNLEGVPTLRGAGEWRASSVQSASGYQRPRPRRRRTELPPIPRRRSQAT